MRKILMQKKMCCVYIVVVDPKFSQYISSLFLYFEAAFSAEILLISLERFGTFAQFMDCISIGEAISECNSNKFALRKEGL